MVFFLVPVLDMFTDIRYFLHDLLDGYCKNDGWMVAWMFMEHLSVLHYGLWAEFNMPVYDRIHPQF